MTDIAEAFAAAFSLVYHLDSDLGEIVLLSLQVSVGAVAVASAIGLPLGAAVALFRFPGRGAMVVLLNALMGLPPVVVGLVVYLVLSRAGPLGVLGLLFTPTAMVIAQVLLVTPIVAALARQVIEDLWSEYEEQLRSLGATPQARADGAALGRALQPADRRACGLRPRHRRGRRGHDRRRQHRPRDPRHDHGDRARGLQGRPRAGTRPRHRPGRALHRRQHRRSAPARHPGAGVATMTAAASILPLELRGVSFERDRQRLLKEVSVRVAEGPKTIVLGPNGAGKSLLLRLCHGLIAPTEGAVLWHGAAGRDPLRFQAMVMQRPVMLRRSVAANIDFALGLRRVPRPERRRLIAEALERTGLGAFARVPARVLSFGEQQRSGAWRAPGR